MMVGKPSGRNPHKSSARNLKFSIDSLGEAVEPVRGNLLIFVVSQRCCLFVNDQYLGRASISFEYQCTYHRLHRLMYWYIYGIIHYTYMYVHTYIYIHIIYTCSWYTVACNTLNAWFPTKHTSHSHPKTACEMSFVLGFAALPHCANRRHCHCHTSSFKQMLSCPQSYEWVQFLQKGFNHFYRFL